MRRTYARSSGATHTGRRSPWTHILAPTAPGAISASRLQPYSTRSNLAKARKLARGHFRDGRVVIGYRGGRRGRSRSTSSAATSSAWRRAPARDREARHRDHEDACARRADEHVLALLLLQSGAAAKAGLPADLPGLEHSCARAEVGAITLRAWPYSRSTSGIRRRRSACTTTAGWPSTGGLRPSPRVPA